MIDGPESLTCEKCGKPLEITGIAAMYDLFDQDYKAKIDYRCAKDSVWRYKAINAKSMKECLDFINEQSR